MTTDEPSGNPPGRRERKKQLTRAHIADVALTLFAERGFDRVTVAEIADAADVSEQTVFNHFPTKEDLVYWRLGDFEERLLDAIRSRDRGETVLIAFTRFLHTPRRLLDPRDTHAHEQATASARLVNDSPALQRREQLVFASYTDALASLIADEIGAGADDVTPWVAANAMMGVHRAVVAFAQRRMAHGIAPARVARDVKARIDDAVELLGRGLGRYAIKGTTSGI